MATPNKTLEADKAEEAKLQREADSPHEQVYRRRRTHHAFLGTLYGAIGSAAFIGVLNTLVGLALGTTTLGSIILGLPVGVVFGAFVLAGVAATFFAEREFAKMSSLQDNHLAECTARAKKLEREQEKSTALLPKEVQITETPERKFTNSVTPRKVAEEGFAKSELARRDAEKLAPVTTSLA